MAKILFIVNDHPNEAFAISVAREAAKRLRADGHEIVWKMTNPKDTVLGKVLKNPNMEVKAKTFIDAQRGTYDRMGRLIQKHNPKVTSNFHATPHDDPLWTDPRKPAADFEISYSKLHGRTVMFIEVKARYTKLPKRHLEKGRIAIPAHSPYHGAGHYLREGTSQQLTREMGLTPEILGTVIAKRIENRARRPKTFPQNERGTVPRVFKSFRRNNIRRRPR